MKISVLIFHLLFFGCRSLYQMEPEPQYDPGTPLSLCIAGSGRPLGNARFFLPDSLSAKPDPAAYYSHGLHLKFRARLADGREIDVKAGKLRNEAERIISLDGYPSGKIRIILSVGNENGWNDMQYATIYPSRRKKE